MTRALTVACLTFGLALFGAAAEAKPSVAVLGLEVSAPDNGNVDQQTTAAASSLTQALRERVRAGTGAYDLAQGADKELIDLKLLNECSNELMPCMAKIGNDLGAKYMLYGHLVNKGAVYHVTMTLLNVENKSKGGSRGFDVPVADLSGGPKGKDTLVWARKIYGEMTGETSAGTVVVKLSGGADHGTVLVEENGQWQPKGSITSGQARVSLPEGKYKIAVDSEGYQRFESTITVLSGTDTQVPAQMAPARSAGTGDGSAVLGLGSNEQYGNTVSDGNPNDGWHKVFIGSSIATGVMVVGFGVSFGELYSTGHRSGLTFGAKCDPTYLQPHAAACGSGDTYNTLSYVSGIGAIVFAGFAGFALYESHRSTPMASGEHALGHRSHRQFAVVPVLTPTVAGGSFRIDF